MELDRFLICGLGSLGQHCVANLKTFGVTVSAVDLIQPDDWEVPNLPNLLEKLLIGDCCTAGVLDRAGVRLCRAILLVTQNERVNLEAALTARVINPDIRLVIRSDKQNLNQLLGHQLGNFAAFEPTQLSATAFALAAFGEELLGFFRLGEYRFQIIKQQITPDHYWCDKRCIHELNTRTRQVLRHISADQANLPLDGWSETDSPYSPSAQFYTWLPNTTIRAGDIVVTITAEPELKNSPKSQPRRSGWQFGRCWRRIRQIKGWREAQRSLLRLWRSGSENQIRRVAMLCGMTVLILCVGGVLLFRLHYPNPNQDLTLLDAFYATMVLLLGGYGDLFSDLPPTEKIPWWLRLFSLGLTLAGTAFIGVLYALLTEKLLTLKFQFLTRRPPVPQQAHVVVIWLGRVGQQVATLLQELKQPIVGVTQPELEPHIVPQMPLITGNIANALTNANLSTAKSVVAVSEDEVQNLEMGLMAHRVNPDCRLIIRTYDQRFSDKVAQLFPYAQVLCASALSAEAFAAAAFGENVVSLFRLYFQTILVTQYTIEAKDTLNGLLISEIAYGYGVEPILHQRSATDPPKAMPSSDIRLQAGDRLFVLASIRGLRRIEQGQLAERHWLIKVEAALTHDARFDGAGEIACITGCDIGAAREFMAHLPSVFPQRLYRHQALRLVRRLIKLRVKAQVLPVTPNSEWDGKAMQFRG